MTEDSCWFCSKKATDDRYVGRAKMRVCKNHIGYDW